MNRQRSRPDPATAGNATSAPRAAEAMAHPVPTALRWLVPAVAVGVVLLVALPAVMVLDRDFTVRAIMADNPGLDPAHLDFAVNVVLVDAVAWHTIDVVLSIWFVVKVLQRRQWARIALTVYLVIATLGSLYSAVQGTPFLWAVIPGDAVHLAMLALLWIPGSVRRFFAAPPGPGRPGRGETNAGTRS